jgi:8-oxo-dGTP pyrophosphatase MutT (NUDIX family)
MAYAAGILPYTIHYGQIFMLLGKDVRDGSWSDFGGKSEAVDSKPLDTACREFYEETCGIVIDPKALHVRMAGQVPFSRTYTQHGKVYYMYTLQLPFRADHRSNFRRMLAYMKHINCFKRKVEKTDIRWVPVDAMLKGTIRLRSVFENTFGRWWQEHGPTLVKCAKGLSVQTFKLAPASACSGVYKSVQVMPPDAAPPPPPPPAPFSTSGSTAWGPKAFRPSSL